MSLPKLVVMYGHIDGAHGKFPRDPSGHLGVKTGVFEKNGLEVSWQHVQGTEERYRKLEDGSAQISFVVGRAALQHFLSHRKTRILGSAMNSCPYYLLVDRELARISDLQGKVLACMESVARSAPVAAVFEQKGLRANEVELKATKTDQEAFDLLADRRVAAALLPRLFGFLAAERGCNRISDWPDVIDDPLPVTIETTETLLREREKDFALFVTAHREGIHYLKRNRPETMRMLGEKFGYSPSLAGRVYDEYLVWLDDRLTIDARKLEQLVTQVAPDQSGAARQLALEWIVSGVLRN